MCTDKFIDKYVVYSFFLAYKNDIKVKKDHISCVNVQLEINNYLGPILSTNMYDTFYCLSCL